LAVTITLVPSVPKISSGWLVSGRLAIIFGIRPSQSILWIFFRVVMDHDGITVWSLLSDKISYVSSKIKGGLGGQSIESPFIRFQYFNLTNM
jgi:hypothetical protein